MLKKSNSSRSKAKKRRKVYWSFDEITKEERNRGWALLKLAQKGDVEAMFDLALFYEYTFHDEKKSFVWMERAAKAGHVSAKVYMADFIIFGWVDDSLETAFSYLKQAAEAGDKLAHWNLSDFYMYGWVSEPSCELAKKHIIVAKGRLCAAWILRKSKKIPLTKERGMKVLEAIREFYN